MRRDALGASDERRRAPVNVGSELCSVSAIELNPTFVLSIGFVLLRGGARAIGQRQEEPPLGDAPGLWLEAPRPLGDSLARSV